MREWFAWNAIERWREKCPDLTELEEKQLFEFYMSEDDRNLFFRCSFESNQPAVVDVS